MPDKKILKIAKSPQVYSIPSLVMLPDTLIGNIRWVDGAQWHSSLFSTLRILLFSVASWLHSLLPGLISFLLNYVNQKLKSRELWVVTITFWMPEIFLLTNPTVTVLGKSWFFFSLHLKDVSSFCGTHCCRTELCRQAKYHSFISNIIFLSIGFKVFFKHDYATAPFS